jgi:hypothetical protein
VTDARTAATTEAIVARTAATAVAEPLHHVRGADRNVGPSLGCPVVALERAE